MIERARHWCLDTGTFTACNCLPLKRLVLVIFGLVLIENFLYFANPLCLVPSLGLSIVFLLYAWRYKAVQLRHCIWITYLIVGICQLFVAIVVFGITVYFPEKEDCTQRVDRYGRAEFECLKLQKEADPAMVTLLLILIFYYLLKSSVLVVFLHGFAQQPVIEERRRLQENQA